MVLGDLPILTKVQYFSRGVPVIKKKSLVWQLETYLRCCFFWPATDPLVREGQKESWVPVIAIIISIRVVIIGIDAGSGAV